MDLDKSRGLAIQFAPMTKFWIGEMISMTGQKVGWGFCGGARGVGYVSNYSGYYPECMSYMEGKPSRGGGGGDLTTPHAAI